VLSVYFQECPAQAGEPSALRVLDFSWGWNCDNTADYGPDCAGVVHRVDVTI
jgi:hypothetical protein